MNAGLAPQPRDGADVPDPTQANGPDDDTIEVGAVAGELRFWLANEAMRQGEGRLNAQAAIRSSLEARATALTGWAAVSLLAATGAAFTVRDMAGQLGAAVTGTFLFAAASIGIHAARPRAWSMVGYDPVLVASDKLESELEVLESIGQGLSSGIQANNLRLDAMGKRLRWAGFLLILGPACGAATYEAAPVLNAWSAGLRQLFP